MAQEYKLRSNAGPFYLQGERYEGGEYVELTDQQAEAFADVFVDPDTGEAASVDAEADADADAGPDQAASDAHATDTNQGSSESFDPAAFVDRAVEDVRDDIRSGEYDGALGAIEEAESADRDRTTVHDELEGRRGGSSTGGE